MVGSFERSEIDSETNVAANLVALSLCPLSLKAEAIFLSSFRNLS